MFATSPVESFQFANRQLYIKRDDLLHPGFSGNKARKFAYFLDHQFDGVTKVIGYGSAQANSLYSLSVLAKMKGWQCDFYVDHIASHIRENPSGNYAHALAQGARVIDLQQQLIESGESHKWRCEDYIQQRVLVNEPNALFIPEGGRCSYAKYGLDKLGAEIIHWGQVHALSKLKVFFPSGTGTTALFLNQYFIENGSDIRVLTCAAVGGDDYLRFQFLQLNSNESLHPVVLNTGKKYHFGKLYAEFYAMWRRVCAQGIEFELLYDPLGFLVLESYLRADLHSPILYLHQGGLLGNETMLPRYQRKFG
ncbi:pyridoxal-phosphate dependent enzyme [Shewanella acanthi]|uniref:pyridoxal-phosphate dependent enzyme n=1 Tax=Shewanella acanthi TaxID=2864212 RepID=UPI001C65F344|nr:pyridoxal-phosphate dependent enzyme [Shewanella acanthi]QYJ77556.1 pyridoxal-phosphate dependent enzyme [Shewanella acanthi]